MARMMGKFRWHNNSKPPKGISSLRPREARVFTKEMMDDAASHDYVEATDRDSLP
jgi:hypothetical protein